MFPRTEKYSLGNRIEDRTLELIEGFFAVNGLPNSLKRQPLSVLSNKLEVLKLLVRLAFETKCIDQKKYLTLQATLQEVGRMLGGWIRSVS